MAGLLPIFSPDGVRMSLCLMGLRYASDVIRCHTTRVIDTRLACGRFLLIRHMA